jgi:hypothetical protein
VVTVLAQDEGRPAACRGDVALEVRAVDLVPDAVRLHDGLRLCQVRVALEVRRRVAKGGFAQPEETLGVPPPDVLRRRVDVHGEVEEVAHRQTHASVGGDACRLQDVEALDQHDVRMLDHLVLVGPYVVLEVRVHGGLDTILAGLDVDDEPQQSLAVVRLREALPVQQSATLELRVRVEEPVGRHEGDVRVFGPVREELAEQPGGRRLADRNRTGDPDHEGRPIRLARPQEELGLPVERAHVAHVEAQQPRARQVDVGDLVEVELLAQAAQPLDLCRR